MVKNDAGGNKGKGLARKHVNAAKCGSSKQLRVATEEAEKYAIVSKILGNGMCYVRLLTGGGERLCIIRNKFKGRGKRDNILESGSWVLVGMREWSSKQETCDLLEVYNLNERDRLLKNEPCFKSVSAEIGGSSSSSSSSSSSVSIVSNVQFADSTTMKYSSMLNKRNSDEEDDDEDMMQQQRVYDMPSSSDDEDENTNEDEDSDDSDDSDTVPIPPIPLNKIKASKVAEINVDDI